MVKPKRKPHLIWSLLPRNARRTFRSSRRWLRCWYAGLWDEWYRKKLDLDYLPPASLRFRVHDSVDVESFFRVGGQCRKELETAVASIGREISSFHEVLEFGCGCGRTLLEFARLAPTTRLHGTDTDAEAISWCRNHLKFGSFEVNEPLPPFRYRAERFDLIYAISVFTHLDEEAQFRWLDELKRVARSGAVLLLSVHGHHCWKDLPAEEVERIERTGFGVRSGPDTWHGLFPEWYQNAFHTKDYVHRNFSKYFEILDYLPRGIIDLQDLVVLRKT